MSGLRWLVVCLLLPSVAADIQIQAPAEVTAGDEFPVELLADPAAPDTWTLWVDGDDGSDPAGSGSGLPSNVTLAFGEPGRYTLRLEAGEHRATSALSVLPTLLARAVENATILVDGAPRAGTPSMVRLDNPSVVEAPWELFLLQGSNLEPVASGAVLPASVEVTPPAAHQYTLVLAIDADGQRVIREADFHAAAPDGPAISGDVLPLLFAGALMLGLAVWLLVRDRTRPINVAFAVLFIARGTADIVLALWVNLGTWTIRPGEGWDLATGGVARHLHAITNVTVLVAAFYFLYAYLAQNHATLARRHKSVGAALAGAAVLLILVYLAIPSVWWDGAGRPGGWLFMITGLYYPFYAVFALLLFRESVRDIPDDRRAGAFWSGLGFLFLPVYSGAGELLFVDLLDYFSRLESVGGASRASLGFGFEVGHWVTVLALIPALGASIYLGRDASQNPGRPGSRSHFLLYFLAILLPLLSLGVALVVFFDGEPVAAAIRSLTVFNVFQGIWAIPYPVLVAYGLMRYQASDEQTKMRRQVRRFGLASLFFAVFFAVSEGLEALAADRFGTEIGLASAAALTLILNPIQERLQHKVVDPADETPQEIAFYVEQVRRTLEDGSIGPVERKFLQNLQETMGIKPATAAAIEQDLMA